MKKLGSLTRASKSVTLVKTSFPHHPLQPLAMCFRTVLSRQDRRHAHQRVGFALQRAHLRGECAVVASDACLWLRALCISTHFVHQVAYLILLAFRTLTSRSKRRHQNVRSAHIEITMQIMWIQLSPTLQGGVV